MSLIFYNHFHNGDIFHAKEFVRDVADQLPNEKVVFMHNMDPSVVCDLENVEYRPMSPLLWDKAKNKSMHIEGDLCINTHIGAFFGMKLPFDYECTLRFNLRMWEFIYERLSSIYDKELILSTERDYYIPQINFQRFQIGNIDTFVKTEKREKILVCNGPVHSGQAPYDGDMKEFVQNWAQKYPHLVFILTKMTDLEMENVCYTDQIIGINGCDLNEIGYLSTHCKMTIGRNSGPFCFATNRETVSNPNRCLLSFGKSKTDAFLLGILTGAEYVFCEDVNKMHYVNMEIERRLERI